MDSYTLARIALMLFVLSLLNATRAMADSFEVITTPVEIKKMDDSTIRKRVDLSDTISQTTIKRNEQRKELQDLVDSVDENDVPTLPESQVAEETAIAPKTQPTTARELAQELTQKPAIVVDEKRQLQTEVDEP